MPELPRLRISGRAVLTLAIIALCFVLLANRLKDIRWSDVASAMAATPPEAMLLALVFGLMSHFALAGYDLLAFSRIGRKVPWPRALKGGFAGAVMSQVLGFGLITGSLARARIYRANGISAPEAVALSGFVATGFFLGLGGLLALLLLADPSVAASVTGLAPWAIRALAGAGLAVLVLCGVLGSLWPRRLRLGKLALRLPDGAWMAKATLLAAADLVPAALCLAVLLPETALPSLAAFVAIYVTGVALGHMIGAPGAAGPFEGILFLALSSVAAPELAAGILLYRLIYYMPPFAAALILIARAGRAPNDALLSGTTLRTRMAWVMDETSQAEAELAFLGDKRVYFPEAGEGFISYGISGRIWLMMGDPVGPPRAWADLIAGLRAEAEAVGASLVAYKATAAAQPIWEAEGYRAHSLGEEASLDLTTWSCEGSAKRELRRKISAARKAGVSVVCHEPGDHPLEAMAEVADEWRLAKGGEQGFSMGRWSPGFNARHMAVTAWQGDRLIAFATFWVSGDGSEWMLDLIRQRSDLPNGTIYAIIVEAAALARERGATRFNLCMAPLSGLEKLSPTLTSRLGHWFYTRFGHRHHLQGMRRFKEVFRPDWSPRMLVVPNGAALPEALLAAHRLVQNAPDPAQDPSRIPHFPATPHAAWPEDEPLETRSAA